MADNSKKTKANAVPKKDAAVTADSVPAKDASKDTAKPDAPKDVSKDTSKPETPKDAPKAEGGGETAAAPANYSRGEGQKPVTAAYRENWNAIFAKKSKKKKKR